MLGIKCCFSKILLGQWRLRTGFLGRCMLFLDRLLFFRNTHFCFFFLPWFSPYLRSMQICVCMLEGRGVGSVPFCKCITITNVTIFFYLSLKIVVFINYLLRFINIKTINLFYVWFFLYHQPFKKKYCDFRWSITKIIAIFIDQIGV